MKTELKLHGGVCTLRQIELEDCTLAYVDWLNDPDINRFLETKWVVQNEKSIRDFVETQIEDPNSVLFAITAKDGRHIGNIKIGPIHGHYQHADISYFIGDKGEWGKGRATDAIRLVCLFGFCELGLHRIEAGTYDCAVGSQKVLEKVGFRREAILREKVFFEGRWIDVYRYGLLTADFTKTGNGGIRDEYERCIEGKHF